MLLQEEVEVIEDVQNRVLMLEEQIPDFATWKFLHESLNNLFNYIELVDKRSKAQGRRIRELGKEIKEKKNEV